MAFTTRALATSLVAVRLDKVEWQASGVGAFDPSVVRLGEKFSCQDIVSGTRILVLDVVIVR